MTQQQRQEQVELDDHPSNKDKIECGWCGKTFKTGEEKTAYMKEGLHRAKEHINPDESISKPTREDKNDTSLVEEWGKNNQGKASTGGKKA